MYLSVKMMTILRIVTALAPLLMFSGCGGDGPRTTTYSFSHRTIPKDQFTQYIFESKYPPPISQVSDALRQLGLPPTVVHSVPYLTWNGPKLHDDYHHGKCWQNYERGPLRVVPTTRSDANYDRYDAIWKIIIYEPGTPAFCGHEKLADLVPTYPFAN